MTTAIDCATNPLQAVPEGVFEWELTLCPPDRILVYNSVLNVEFYSAESTLLRYFNPGSAIASVKASVEDGVFRVLPPDTGDFEWETTL